MLLVIGQVLYLNFNKLQVKIKIKKTLKSSIIITVSCIFSKKILGLFKIPYVVNLQFIDGCIKILEYIDEKNIFMKAIFQKNYK